MSRIHSAIRSAIAAAKSLGTELLNLVDTVDKLIKLADISERLYALVMISGVHEFLSILLRFAS